MWTGYAQTLQQAFFTQPASQVLSLEKEFYALLWRNYLMGSMNEKGEKIQI